MLGHHIQRQVDGQEVREHYTVQALGSLGTRGMRQLGQRRRPRTLLHLLGAAVDVPKKERSGHSPCSHCPFPRGLAIGTCPLGMG